MKKYVLKGTTNPVVLGEFIEISCEKNFSFGSYISKERIRVTDTTLPQLIKNGIIEEIDGRVNKFEVPTNINYYVEAVAKRLNYEVNATYDLLEMFNKAGYSKAVLDILLKEVKAKINHKPGGFEIPDKIWCFNIETGNIFSLANPNKEKPNVISAFYSKEDAELAKSILKKQFEYTYGK